MHPLLQRQLRRHLQRHLQGDTPEGLADLLAAVSAAYDQADDDRRMIERSLDLMSEELLEKNRELAQSLGRADARAQFGERRLQSLMDTLAEGIVIYDASARIADINDEAAGFFGVTREEALGERATSTGVGVTFLRADGAPAEFHELPTVQAFTQQRASRNRIVGVRRHDGSEIFLRANSAPIFVEGHPSHVVVTYTDVTSELAIERMKTEFVAIASHELRTPLTGIMGFAQLLRTRGDLPEDATSWAGLIEVEATRLSRIASDLLDVARLEVGALSFQKVPTDLATTVNSVFAQLRTATPNHELRARGANGASALCDPDRLTQVLFNLVENAVKYSPHGGGVEVHWATVGGTAVIEVRDEGLGIPPTDIPKLFTRFYRVEDARYRDIRGTGVGLYLVNELVLGMGGRIEVRSKVGVGSTFTVVLPAATSAAAPAA